MKIKILKGTTLSGKPVNPGEIHEVDTETCLRLVNIFKDAELVKDEPPKSGTSEQPASVEPEGKKKGKKI